MKKILTLALSLCLLASVVACFAISANAEDTLVTVGQTFEWNDQSADATTQKAWRTSKGVSPDGLWRYQFYSLAKGTYHNLVTAGNMFAWTSNPGSDDNGIGYARVRNNGKNFHPAEKADVVKRFTCPSGGTIQITSVVARASQLQAGGSATGTSFAIYLEDQLVYPTDGSEYVTLVSTAEQTLEATFEVKKNQNVYIRIGAIGNQGSDAIDMSNVVTYKSVNDEAVEGIVEDVTTSTATKTGPDLPDFTDADGKGSIIRTSNSGGTTNVGGNDGGLGTGAIIGIVVAAVAVVGIAAAVIVIVMKKKKASAE